MTDFISSNYEWFKALHIIAVISFMAGMLYLPRLFVYHAGAEIGSELSETLKVMERRLLRFIMNPALILMWGFAILMLIGRGDILMTQGWVHVKLTLVIALSGVHGVFSKWRKVFERDENTKSAKFYKIWNEVPTVLMIIIVILAIVKPF
tara:strand:- start:92244 stop:92693 length:450 start_codon:yes stop_codon:yes gene_type:complete